MERLFSLFEAPISAPNNLTPARNISLAEAFKYISGSEELKELTQRFRSLPAEKQMQVKRNAFKAATFSGTFSYRKAAALEQESELICVDIDHASAQGWDAEALKGYIAKDRNLAAKLAFISPSGDGLKVILDRPSGFTHKAYFSALQNYFEAAYSINIDKQCSDISRPCFLPYDEHAYYNEAAKIEQAALLKWSATYSATASTGTEARTVAKSIDEKTGLPGAFCRCYTVPEAIEAFLADVYTKTASPNRYTYTNGTSYGGLVVMPDGYTAYSHHSTDPAGGRACSAFDLVRIHKFGNDEGGPGSASFRSMADFVAADPKVKKYLAETDFGALASDDTEPVVFSPELQDLLEKVQKINFRKKAEEYGLAPDAKLTRKIILVVAVRELIKQVEATGAGLTSSHGRAYVYAGGYWHETAPEEMRAFLTAAAIALGMTPNEAQHFENQEHLYKQFEATARLSQPQRRKDKILVNFKNGTLEIASGRKTLREPNKADFLKYQLPYNYDPGAACPEFKRYLYRVLPDASAQAVLAEFIGNALAPSLNLQKALVLKGSGDNGKSVFFTIVTALLGSDNVSSYSMESLTKQDSRSRAELENKLLNYCSENSIKLGVEAFKTLVRNEPIEVRRLYGESYIMENYARIMFNCNLLPKDTEQTEGFFRSFLIIPFKEKISEAEKDPELASKIIRAELPGIFNWVLEGLDRLLGSRKFTECKSARQELEDYRKESSSVLMFLEECEVKPSAEASKWVSLQRLYNWYGSYCLESGHRFKVNKRTFSSTLRDNNFLQGRNSSGVIIYCEYSDSCTEFYKYP